MYGIQCHSGQAYPGVALAVHRLQNVHCVPGLRRPGKFPRKSAREIHADLLITASEACKTSLDVCMIRTDDKHTMYLGLVVGHNAVL